MTEIEKVKAQIQVLQKKLDFLEELEKTKSPVEEAYKDWWGEYPGDENWTSDATRWQGFQAGYNAAYEEKVAQEPEENEWKSVALRFGEKLSGYLSDGYYELSPAAWFRWAVFTYGKGQQIKDAVRESVEWCEEHQNEDPLDWLKPQNPEQTEQSLKEAFREAVKQGIIHEVDKVSDVFMNEMVAELKGQTLRDVCMDWWDRVFGDTDDTETCIDNLVDEISLWLPKPQSAAGSQNAYVESAVEGFNDCLNTIKRKLR
jgi:hypothetical protein